MTCIREEEEDCVEQKYSYLLTYIGAGTWMLASMLHLCAPELCSFCTFLQNRSFSKQTK